METHFLWNTDPDYEGQAALCDWGANREPPRTHTLSSALRSEVTCSECLVLLDEEEQQLADILGQHVGYPSERYVGKFEATEKIYYVICCDCGWEDAEAEEAKAPFGDYKNHRLHVAKKILEV